MKAQIYTTLNKQTRYALLDRYLNYKYNEYKLNTRNAMSLMDYYYWNRESLTEGFISTLNKFLNERN